MAPADATWLYSTPLSCALFNDTAHSFMWFSSQGSNSTPASSPGATCSHVAQRERYWGLDVGPHQPWCSKC